MTADFMKSTFSTSWFSMAGLLCGFALCAAAAEDDPNRFSLGLRMGFNIDAKFKDAGSASQPGPATGGGLDRTYDDGFVRQDASGNQGGMTWNWGYDRADQIAGQNLSLHSSSASALPSLSRNEDPQIGAELGYERRLGEWSWAKYGLLAAFNFTDVEIRGSRSAVADGTLLTDSYALGGIVPPVPPYAGSWDGPGPVIGDSPTRATQLFPGGAAVQSKRQLDAQVYGWRLGPYLEVPLTDWLNAQVSGGLALGVVDSEFTSRESITLAGRTNVRSARESDSDLLAGGYAEAQLSFRLCPRASVFTGAQFQYLPDFEQKAGGQKAELELGSAIFFTLGLKVHF